MFLHVTKQPLRFRVIWVVLFFELMFECMIRPSDYLSLIETDKAYAPLTARNINRFHLGFELIALLMFIPSIICIVTDYCQDRIWFNGVEAALSAVKSDEAWRAALGRFSLSLTFLRSFGLVRHWKQMWIVHTVEGKNSNGNSKFYQFKTAISLLKTSHLTSFVQILFENCFSLIMITGNG